MGGATNHNKKSQCRYVCMIFRENFRKFLLRGGLHCIIEHFAIENVSSVELLKVISVFIHVNRVPTS